APIGGRVRRWACGWSRHAIVGGGVVSKWVAEGKLRTRLADVAPQENQGDGKSQDGAGGNHSRRVGGCVRREAARLLEAAGLLVSFIQGCTARGISVAPRRGVFLGIGQGGWRALVSLV